MARIIDLTAHPGVYATRLLAETGNEVIRVESASGDDLRKLGPYLGQKPDLEKGAYHQFFNAGKKSFKLNLESPTARNVLLNLIGTADAVVASTPLSFDENQLLEGNPRLVLVKVIEDEPELCAVARSGLLTLTGHPGQRPVLLGGHVVYAATGLYVAVATAGALFALQLTGQGQLVEVSIRQCLESLAEQSMVDYTSLGQVTERCGYRGAITAVSGAFPVVTVTGWSVCPIRGRGGESSSIGFETRCYPLTHPWPMRRSATRRRIWWLSDWACGQSASPRSTS